MAAQGWADDAILRAIEWVEAAGGAVGPLCFEATAGERGAFAGRPIAAGEVLLSVPRARLITGDRVAATPPGRFVSEHLDLAAHPQVLLALFLVHATRTRDPAWTPYTDTLPAAMPHHPLFFADADLARLRGTMCHDLLVARRERLEVEWDRLRRGAPGLADLEWGEWAFARTLVASRAFALSPDRVPTLVPLADLLNHAPAPEATWNLLDATGSVQVRADVDVAGGAEVRDTYGAKSNGRLLLHYGFVLPDNPVEDCVIDLGDAGAYLLRPSATAPEVQQMLARLAALPEGRERLARACRERLARLPESVDAPAESENGRNVLVVRDVERRVLRWWDERLANAASLPTVDSGNPNVADAH